MRRSEAAGDDAPPHMRLPIECPPNDALDPGENVLRLVKTNPPTAADFRPISEENPSRARVIVRNGIHTECEIAGLSVWATREALATMLRRVKGLRHLLWSEANLEPRHGKIKPTCGEGHRTWWPSAETQPHSLFRVIPRP